MSILNEVLRAFENVSQPLSLDELSRRMDMERGALEGVIQLWVRKGQRISRQSHCTSARWSP
jgi:hypothetical protein